LRDPKLSITPQGELMVLAGGSVYEGEVLRTRQPRVAASTDGQEWGLLYIMRCRKCDKNLSTQRRKDAKDAKEDM
ncbi:MAG: hypothetical protein R6X15_11545, partial [Pseudomonadota bacterium]